MSVMTAAASAPTFAFIGGHPTLDLLNTVEWRLDPGQRSDDVTAYGHVLAWAEQAGLITGAERTALDRLAPSAPQATEQELEAFRALRETAYAALVERDTAAVDQLVAAYRDLL